MIGNIYPLSYIICYQLLHILFLCMKCNKTVCIDDENPVYVRPGSYSIFEGLKINRAHSKIILNPCYSLHLSHYITIASNRAIVQTSTYQTMKQIQSQGHDSFNGNEKNGSFFEHEIRPIPGAPIYHTPLFNFSLG